ncbi:DUF3558 family protein [Gordonia humi]|uniref:Ribosome-associated heat shock protein Hsp15 n=1 Tax=Gordonia humi TaxID=686429 RepID=A0A840F3M6_9ACTN|nr:DUF3558 family protein [Gordonia humi]MBB4134880.1 ribosome-associated heat shock protein Hsp15 [Gordonia humi]
MATRIDSWIWAIRLTKTRSAAGAACRAGHVQLNGVTVKPSAQVAIGDRVTVRQGSRDRIVEVTGLIGKRVSAPVAAENYIDHSPPPPPREVLASIPRRDRGAGRPTKRERRELDRFRSGALLVLAAVAVLGLSACGGDGTADSVNETYEPRTGTGPDFERCGGLTADEVVKATGVPGFELAVDNPSTCEWRLNADRNPSVSFNWYRGSPIGRERGTEQLSRDMTEDYEIDGQPGFIAHTGPICEIGVAWDADFIEISVHLATSTEQLKSTDEICQSAKRLTETVVKGAS